MQADNIFKGITMSRIDMSLDIRNKEEINYNVSGKAKCFKPASGDEKSALLVVTISSRGDEEKFRFVFETSAQYEFEERPEDYGKFVAENCLPDAIKRTYEMIDAVMVSTGNNPLNLEGIELK